VTDLATAPAATTTPPSAGRGSLVRAEVRRLRSRRFIRLLLALAAVLALLAVGLAAATAFGKTTPARLAAAQQEVDRVVAEQERFRQQCLQDPNRPDDVPEELYCGEPVSADSFRAQDFLDRRPFVLAEDLPAGALAVAAATAALGFVVGATWIGAEWSSRSIVALLFWEPRRWKVMGVKLAVLAAAAALLAVVSQALWWVTARIMAAALGRSGPLPDGFYGDLLAQQGRAVLLLVIVSGLGFGLSNLTRSTGAALGIGFVYFAVVETAVRNIRPAWQEWLLTDNAVALLQQGGHRIMVFGEGFVDESGTYVDTGREVLLTNTHGALVLAVTAAAIVALGALLFSRRDLH